MTSAIVIPARLESTRLPGKLLQDVHGKPLIVRTVEAASKSQRASVTLVTDSVEIANSVKQFASATALATTRIVITHGDYRSGSARVAAGIADLPAEVVVNWQADEPQVNAADVDALIDAVTMKNVQLLNPLLLGTMVCPLAAADSTNPNIVKATLSLNNRVLYFSRQPLPGAVRHVGVYCFHRSQMSMASRSSRLAVLEDLEQMVFLEYGYMFHAHVINYTPIKVDTAGDLEALRQNWG